MKYTPRRLMHRIIASDKGAWALSFRGPWKKTWQENKNGVVTTLTHGRKVVETEKFPHHFGAHSDLCIYCGIDRGWAHWNVGKHCPDREAEGVKN